MKKKDLSTLEGTESRKPIPNEKSGTGVAVPTE